MNILLGMAIGLAGFFVLLGLSFLYGGLVRRFGEDVAFIGVLATYCVVFGGVVGAMAMLP